jgi:hypothetical protein
VFSSIRNRVGLVIGATLLISAFAAPMASAKGLVKPPLTVCKHGCKYHSIQAAVDASGKGATIKVKPGRYVGGTEIDGPRHDGLKIIGTGKKPGAVVLDGKSAPINQAQNGIYGENVDGLDVENLTVKRFLGNGVFVHACHGYLMKNLVAAFNRSYGLFAKSCTGGRMTKSTGYGQGDSAYYIGETPHEAHPKWTSLDHLKAYENVLGYSGTNSKYVNIHDSDFFNNGIGLVPNTLDSEKFEPTSNGIIQNNNIFWNNFDYYLPTSKVKTVSDGLGSVGTLTLNYPIGIGVTLFGATGWKVKNNNIFGNFKWGVAMFSDPFNAGDDAISTNNQVKNNKMGRSGSDKNQFDFWVDGSGSGNCFSGNGAGATFDPSGSATQAYLYPTCPAPAPPASGSGTSGGDGDQVGELIGYDATPTADPHPEKMECSWVKHSHPAFKGYHALTVTPVATCP